MASYEPLTIADFSRIQILGVVSWSVVLGLCVIISLRSRRLRTVIRDQMKLIWASDGRHELFDLEADPAEATNYFDLPGCAQPTQG